MSDPSDPLITVVAPAHNAAETIHETLLSVRAQTYRNLEILVVDDGSTDGTAEIAAAHAAEDQRVRLIRQSNGGVASARNRGVAESRSDLIAPIDADDLWRPDKIERQLEALRAGGDKVALVYTWYALIDAESRVIRARPRPPAEGDVLAVLAERNFIGNGSSALIRKSAILEAGGYDPSLRERDAQGCEDWKLYFQIADRHHFAVVPDFLTGYRRTEENMSSDVMRMLRSRELCWEEFSHKHPEFRDAFRTGRNNLMRSTLHITIRRGQLVSSARLLHKMSRHDPGFLARTLLDLPVRAMVGLTRMTGRAIWRILWSRPPKYLDPVGPAPAPPWGDDDLSR